MSQGTSFEEHVKAEAQDELNEARDDDDLNSLGRRHEEGEPRAMRVALAAGIAARGDGPEDQHCPQAAQDEHERASREDLDGVQLEHELRV